MAEAPSRLELGGATLAYRQSGTGPDIVWLAAGDNPGDNWRRYQTPAFDDAYRSTTYDARGVGEDDADRLPLQVLAEVAQHGHGVAGQRSIKIRVPDVRQRYPVGGYLPLPGAPPGRQDRLTYLARPDRLGRQETLPRLGQPLAVSRGGRGHCWYRW